MDIADGKTANKIQKHLVTCRIFLNFATDNGAEEVSSLTDKALRMSERDRPFVLERSIRQ
jgi:hypothetical protein